jgi:hypothetical protein
VTHRDVAERIDRFYDYRTPPLYEPTADDFDYYRDRRAAVGHEQARRDTIVRILMEAYGERDADGIMRPEI